jgi:hypothetical protein
MHDAAPAARGESGGRLHGCRGMLDFVGGWGQRMLWLFGQDGSRGAAGQYRLRPDELYEWKIAGCTAEPDKHRVGRVMNGRGTWARVTFSG